MITGHEPLAYREMVAPGMLGIGLGIMCALVTLHTLLGPLDTRHTLSWIERAAFWGVVGMLDFVMWYAGCVLTLYLARSRPRFHVRLALVAFSVMFAAPCTALTYTGYVLFHSGSSPDVRIAGVYLFNLVFLLFLVALADHLLYLRLKLKRLAAVVDHAGARDHAQASTAADDNLQPADAPRRPAHQNTAAERFFERIPEAVGRDVIFLRVSGHYVEVTTTVGSAVTLMRFSDAVTELGDLGLRIHRSYWVAYRHVTHLVRRNRHRRTLLRVTGDHELPVSRTYLSAVRAAVSSAHGSGAAKTLVMP